MDIYCQRCGEPWDAYGARHGDMNAEERYRFFHGIDCPACHGKPITKAPFRARLTSALLDVLGDDIDGLASELEDAEFLMGEEFWE